MGECGDIGRIRVDVNVGRRSPNGGSLYLYKILSVYAGARCFDDESNCWVPTSYL